METQFKIAGIILVALSLIHVIFPKYFNWEKELKTLSLINRQMMHVHTFFIALTVCMMGLLCVLSSHELISTGLGKKIDIMLGIFWLARLFVQLFVYSPKLWKGKKFETYVHVLFLLLWTYLSIMFLISGFA